MAVLLASLTAAVVLSLVAAHPTSIEEHSGIVVNQLAILQMMYEMRQNDVQPTAASEEITEELPRVLSLLNDTKEEVERLSGEHDSQTTAILQELSEIKLMQINEATSLQEHLAANVDRLEAMESALERMEREVEELQNITLQETAPRSGESIVEEEMKTRHPYLQRLLKHIADLRDTVRQEMCPSNHFLVKNRCFYVNTVDKLTWEAARWWCHRRGGDLAQPADVDELMAAVSDITDGSVWLGASDIGLEGSWVWLSGEPIPTSLKWMDGEPNNTGGENCLQGAGDTSLFNDLSCSVKLNFVCEHFGRVALIAPH